MNELVLTLMVVALIATIGVLVVGIWSMAHGGKYDKEHSAHYMFMRVTFHGLIVVLIAALLLLAAYY